ncbi:hypothetical protein CBI36_13435 [Acetobacter oryzifermentans]|uniref:Uncharacterized protein n=2 Tax=Acetobacter TaxID=434 RepID=A0AAN1U853_9PROT|nr:hypothetical protein CBI36_13435 [Acetobacter oryzifermentans]AXM99394.1 hypothetical protein CJF59_01500 [Acetobacter pomorum]
MIQIPKTTKCGKTPQSGLRLWKAAQAIRLAELRLAAQASVLMGAQTRATSMIGWVVAALAASAALAFNTPYHIAGAILLVGESITGILAVVAIYPCKWSETGARPEVFMDSPAQTELACQESLALYYQNAIQRNIERLNIISILISAGWIMFLATPILACLFQMVIFMQKAS